MVDVTAKNDTSRTAVAEGSIFMDKKTLEMILSMEMEKGPVFDVAKIAAIMAAKKTSGLIPLCHPLNLTNVAIEFHVDKKNSSVRVEAKTSVMGPTGVEMEALTAVSIALLTIYDMCKAVDRGMVIDKIRLLYKAGGKSGEYRYIPCENK